MQSGSVAAREEDYCRQDGARDTGLFSTKSWELIRGWAIADCENIGFTVKLNLVVKLQFERFRI